MQDLLLVALAAGLVYVAIDDVRSFRIRNWIVLVLLVLSVAHVLLAGGTPAEILARLVFCALMFGLFAAAFALGMIGGGDAKLLGVALLWIGSEGAVPFAMLLLLGAALMGLLVRAGRVPSRSAGRRTAMPFGPVIAVAWLITASLSEWA